MEVYHPSELKNNEQALHNQFKVVVALLQKAERDISTLRGRIVELERHQLAINNIKKKKEKRKKKVNNQPY